MKTIWNGITKENAFFVLILGLCPALAVTTTFEAAYVMGLCVLVVLLITSFFVSLIRKLVPESVQIPTYILIIGTMVTLLELVLHAYVPKLYETLGIYLPLIVVNCIVLGRALNVASKKSVGHSVLDALGIGLGYTIALMIVGSLREVLGNNTFTIFRSLEPVTGFRLMYRVVDPNELFPISFFLNPAGAFFLLGCLFTLVQYFQGRRKNHESH